jgi:peptidoglycan/xylan/chitin deacetylase (PgdA/CDA1 family)
MKRLLLRLLSRLSGGRLLLRVRGAGEALYLTFDDGPDPVHTPELMQVLARHGAKATFFLVGSRLREQPQLAGALVAAGHALGNHSDKHPWFDRLAWRRQREEIEIVESLLRTADGRSHHWFRPPHGRLSMGCLWALLSGKLRILLWSVDSEDYWRDAAAVRERLAALPLRGGEVILFHDDGAVAAQALDALLPLWRQRGFRFPALEAS